MKEPYVTTQICVLKTDRKLVAFYDKLRYSPATSYAQIHANGEYTENNRKVRSLIGLHVLDYSNGTGPAQPITTKANISPDEAEFILSRLKAGFPEFEFRQDKIFGNRDQEGYSQVTKLRITRATHDYRGNPLRIPWRIEIENGRGIAVQNPTGGTYMQKDSFQSQVKASINVTDLDMFKLMNRVVRYIHMWEAAVSPALIQNGKQLLQNVQQQRQTERTGGYHAA